MIHTFDLSFHIDKIIANKIFLYLKSQGNTYRKHPAHSYYTNNCWNRVGISAVTICSDKRGYSLELTISPKILVNDDEARLFIESDLETLRKKFRDFMIDFNQNISPYHMPTDIDCYTVRRLDYTIDFEYQNPALVINVFARGMKPQGFEAVRFSNVSYKLSGKRCNCLIYDKGYDLRKNYGMDNISPRFRIEVQNYRSGLKKIAGEYGIEEITISQLWKKEICRGVLKNSVSNIVGGKKFTTLNNLLDIVNASDLPLSYRKRAKTLIRLLNDSCLSLAHIRDLEKAYGNEGMLAELFLEIQREYNDQGKYLTKKLRKIFLETTKDLSFSYAKMYVENLGYSPITLPDESGCEYLESIVDMIDRTY